jgi:acylphosphatase
VKEFWYNYLMLRHLQARIYGRVQGVFFRTATLEKALDLEIKGLVRNEPDGSVYIEAEADEKKLNEFLNWCQQGPGPASVSKIDFEFTDELKNFKEFSIL